MKTIKNNPHLSITVISMYVKEGARIYMNELNYVYKMFSEHGRPYKQYYREEFNIEFISNAGLEENEYIIINPKEIYYSNSSCSNA